MAHDSRPVLVTGGDHRIALAATRALGRAGVPVAVLGNDPWAISFHSRYCRERIVTPPDHEGPAYQDFVLDRVQRQAYAGVLFCDDLAPLHLGAIREQLAPHLPLLLPAQRWLELCMDKRAMLRWAIDAGIGMPATAFPESAEQLLDRLPGMRAPLLVKGVRGDSSRHLQVCPSGRPEEVLAAWQRIAALEADQGLSGLPMVQEYVQGEVYSAIVLALHGQVQARFVMKKIRTWPRWGGICVEGESVHDAAADAAVDAFFTALPWHGIAEVEFIRDHRDGRFRLVEVCPNSNWGLDFAVHAGVNFPRLAGQAMQGREVEASAYRAGRRFVWFLPEGLHYLRRYPREGLGLLLKALAPRVGTDLWPRDPLALLRQLRRAAH